MRPPLRVLIVDDQVSTRKGLRAVLALLPEVGLITEAADGQEALNRAAQRRPDVVLMDMRMPVMDGTKATKRFKERWPDVRVVALTLYPEYYADALAAGADAFVLKGGPYETLREALFKE